MGGLDNSIRPDVRLNQTWIDTYIYIYIVQVRPKSGHVKCLSTSNFWVFFFIKFKFNKKLKIKRDALVVYIKG